MIDKRDSSNKIQLMQLNIRKPLCPDAKLLLKHVGHYRTNVMERLLEVSLERVLLKCMIIMRPTVQVMLMFKKL